MAFEPREHLMKIKNSKGYSDYLEVKWRLVWYREQCPQGTIETQLVHLDLDKDVEAEAFVWNAEKRRSEKVIKTGKGVAIFRATVTDGKGGSATGTKSENAANFPDFIEKAESGSIGRALAALGYGTQFTGDELNEKERIVDSPVDLSSTNGNGTQSNGSNANAASQGQQDQNHTQALRTGQRPNNGVNPPTPGQQGQQINSSSAATPQQLTSIKKLYQRLDKEEPGDLANMSFAQAKQALQDLSAEYNNRPKVAQTV